MNYELRAAAHCPGRGELLASGQLSWLGYTRGEELGAGGKTNKIDTFIIIDGQVVEESEDTLRVFKFQTNFLDIFIWLNKLFSMKFINIVRTL